VYQFATTQCGPHPKGECTGNPRALESAARGGRFEAGQTREAVHFALASAVYAAIHKPRDHAMTYTILPSDAFKFYSFVMADSRGSPHRFEGREWSTAQTRRLPPALSPSILTSQRMEFYWEHRLGEEWLGDCERHSEGMA
jgi:hypothetical protein